jgi:hypothetical protein
MQSTTAFSLTIYSPQKPFLKRLYLRIYLVVQGTTFHTHKIMDNVCAYAYQFSAFITKTHRVVSSLNSLDYYSGVSGFEMRQGQKPFVILFVLLNQIRC